MGRPRNRKTAGLPPGVYFNKGRYFVRGADGSETKIGGKGASRQALFDAYYRIPQTSARPTGLSLTQLADDYMASEQFRRLAPNTQKDATRAIASVLKFPTAAGIPFGASVTEHITVGTMRRYMDKRGETSESRANLELAYTSAMFSWAFEREKVKVNPCKGVKRFHLEARARYVTDAEYQERYALAGELGRTDIQVMMELSYLCRLRKNEIIRIMDSRAFVSPEHGVLAKRGKGSKTQWIGWTERLRAAIDLARSINRHLPTPRLLVSPHSGGPLTLSAFDSAWQELKLKAKGRGQATDWHFHDLKAKGVSDFEGDKHLASGHKTHRMTEVYDRKLGVVASTR